MPASATDLQPWLKDAQINRDRMFCQVGTVSVLEGTYLGRTLMPCETGSPPSWSGQYGSQISHVLRPSSNASARSNSEVRNGQHLLVGRTARSSRRGRTRRAGPRRGRPGPGTRRPGSASSMPYQLHGHRSRGGRPSRTASPLRPTDVSRSDFQGVSSQRTPSVSVSAGRRGNLIAPSRSCRGGRTPWTGRSGRTCTAVGLPWGPCGP